MRQQEIRERSFVIACTAACLMLAGMSWVWRPGELTTALIFVSLVPPASVSIVRAQRSGLVDPLAVFALCYAAYNGVLLFQLSSGIDLSDAPIQPDGPMLFRAGLMSGLGALGLVAGYLTSGSSRPAAMRPGTHSERAAGFITGAVFYALGIVLYLSQYWQIGGYMQAVAMDRGERFELLRNTVSMPYEGFVVGGIALMVYASVGGGRTRWLASSSACLLWLGMVLLQGDRRLALQMMMALGVVAGTMRPKLTKLRPLALVVIAVGYLAAAVFGQYRTLIYDIAAGRSTLKQAQVVAQGEESSVDKPQDSELGAPYMSVLYYSRGVEPLRWGSSYLESIPAVLPRVLYPGAKTTPISFELDESLHEGVGTVYGLGFSPVAEGFANFGFAGPFIAIFIWSKLFGLLSSARYSGLLGLVVSATLLQECVNANRIDFRYVYFESVYCASAGILAVLTMKAVMAIGSRNSRSVPMSKLRRNLVIAAQVTEAQAAPLDCRVEASS